MERKRTGFTLVELLVVISIIGMLVALLIPAVISARERARQGVCVYRLRELALATVHYETVRGRLPGWRNQAPLPPQGEISWVVALFPYLGREDLWEDWRGGGGTAVVYEQVICPSDMGNLTAGGLNYVANRNLFRDTFRLDDDDNEDPEPFVRLETLVGAQRTVMISERVYDDDRPVGGWNNWEDDPQRLTFDWTAADTVHGLADEEEGVSSNHAGMVHVAFADGHVEAVAPETATDDDNYSPGPPPP